MGYEEALSVLGLEGGEDANRVKRAYLKLVKEYGPDRDPERFRRIREAFDVIRNTADIREARARARTSPRADQHAEPTKEPAPLDDGPAPPPLERERMRDPWALVRAPRGFLVHLARESDDLEERVAALTALVELDAFSDVRPLLTPVMTGRTLTHARVFVLACRTVAGLHALGMHAEGVVLKSQLSAWAGVPPARSFLDAYSAGECWTLAWECDQAAAISEPLCRLAASLAVGMVTVDAGPVLAWKASSAAAYRRAVDDFRRAAPSLYARLREPLELDRAPPKVQPPRAPPQSARPPKEGVSWTQVFARVAAYGMLAGLLSGYHILRSDGGCNARSGAASTESPSVTAAAAVPVATPPSEPSDPDLDARARLVSAAAELQRVAAAHDDTMPPELQTAATALVAQAAGNDCRDLWSAYRKLARSVASATLPPDFVLAASRAGGELRKACPPGGTP